MSVPHGILGLLTQGPMHGYQLKTAFEASTGGVWSLNIGQVYTTLDRLARDGLVKGEASKQARRRPYSITDPGRSELERWLDADGVVRKLGRDELLTKVQIAIAASGVDPIDVIDRERSSLLSELQLRRRKRADADDEDIASRLAFDAVVVRLEADLRWLDLCEERLRRPRGGSQRRGK